MSKTYYDIEGTVKHALIELKSCRDKFFQRYENQVENYLKYAFNAGKTEGKAEAQKLVEMVAGMNIDERQRIFGGYYELGVLFNLFSFDEIADMICADCQSNLFEADEPEHELVVGDEIVDENYLKGVITNADTHYHILYNHNGKTRKAKKSANLKWTGKHFKMDYDMEYAPWDLW